MPDGSNGWSDADWSAEHARTWDGESSPTHTAAGQRRAARAAQFLPFAALTGYYELVRQQERVVQPRHELTEEEALELSRTMAQVRRGDMVRVTYYDWDCYRTISGMVARIDPVYRRLQVVKTTIAFDDIRSLERVSGL